MKILRLVPVIVLTCLATVALVIWIFVCRYTRIGMAGVYFGAIAFVALLPVITRKPVGKHLIWNVPFFWTMGKREISGR